MKLLTQNILFASRNFKYEIMRPGCRSRIVLKFVKSRSQRGSQRGKLIRKITKRIFIGKDTEKLHYSAGK